MSNAAPLPAIGELEPIAVTVEQAARALNTSTDTVRRMIKSGELPAYKLRAQWRVRVSDLRELGTRTPAKPKPKRATVSKLRKPAMPRKSTRRRS